MPLIGYKNFRRAKQLNKMTKKYEKSQSGSVADEVQARHNLRMKMAGKAPATAEMGHKSEEYRKDIKSVNKRRKRLSEGGYMLK